MLPAFAVNDNHEETVKRFIDLSEYATPHRYRDGNAESAPVELIVALERVGKTLFLNGHAVSVFEPPVPEPKLDDLYDACMLLVECSRTPVPTAIALALDCHRELIPEHFRGLKLHFFDTILRQPSPGHPGFVGSCLDLTGIPGCFRSRIDAPWDNWSRMLYLDIRQPQPTAH